MDLSGYLQCNPCVSFHVHSFPSLTAKQNTGKPTFDMLWVKSALKVNPNLIVSSDKLGLGNKRERTLNPNNNKLKTGLTRLQREGFFLLKQDGS